MLTLHHLNNSRSQRILWLLEELGTPYEMKRYQRDAVTRLAPPELKDSSARQVARHHRRRVRIAEWPRSSITSSAVTARAR